MDASFLSHWILSDSARVSLTCGYLSLSIDMFPFGPSGFPTVPVHHAFSVDNGCSNGNNTTFLSHGNPLGTGSVEKEIVTASPASLRALSFRDEF